MSRVAGLARFSRYAAWGVLGTGVHYLVLVLAVRVAGMEPVVASTLGAVAGALVNYLLNHRYTFAGNAPHRASAPRYFAVALAGMALNALLMGLFVHGLALHYLLSQLLASGVVLGATYLANSVWSFRHEAG